MRKRFLTKKKRKVNKSLLFIVFIIFLCISFLVSIKKITINLDNEKIVKYILNDNKIDLSLLTSPKFLLNYTLKENTNIVLPSIKNEEIKIDNDKPLVYIFNSHPTEEYKSTNFEVFNINPSVITASYILKEYLEDLGINTLVEEKSTADILRKNEWKYSYSYKASRQLVISAKENNPSIKYFIDLHRDSSKYEMTTKNVDGTKCARLMFVVGKEYDTYEKNYELSKRLNNELNTYYDKFTRGIILKTGKNVNGVYNQDIDKNLILIEVGGQYNEIDEVNCLLSYFAESLYKIIKEDNNE